jgi:N-acetylglucosaminyldiphosphoundecaprenol N-acetyl-beta-D-mannosaminyltransferase
MTISIITPSYGQLDWLRMCVASVADQVGTKEYGWRIEDRGAESVGLKEGCREKELKSEGGDASGFHNPQSLIHNPAHSPLAIEHIIQDGGTAGIEEFAREVGAEFYRDGKLVFGSRPSAFDSRHYRIAIYREADAGMYDALNKGISKISGELWAWINSDEQYLPGTLDFVLKWFRSHPRDGILCGDALLTDQHGEALSYRRVVRPVWLHTRLDHLASASCATFFRKSEIERFGGFDSRWRSIGDAVWMARMLKGGVRVRACGRLLATFAFTGQNTSESPLARREAEEWKLSKDAPPSWLARPVILIHRIRKMLAGAYRTRTVEYDVYAHGAFTRIRKIGRKLGWGWPSEGVMPVSPDEPGTIPVLGTRVLVSDYKGLSTRLLGMAREAVSAVAVDFANTQIVTMRRHDPVFAGLVGCIDMVLPDGMPLVWAMNAKGAALKDRVYGPTFTRRFLASCPQGMTHYLVGGSEECGRRFRERMKELNPSLEFVGGYHGSCSPDGVLDDGGATLEEIKTKRPDFIWVGLGTPKQYGWIARSKSRLDHGILLAVGFAFDVNAGMKPDAPGWMQQYGLTWIYRMASEPRRLAGRYLKWNSLFLVYSAWDALRWTKRRPASPTQGIQNPSAK